MRYILLGIIVSFLLSSRPCLSGGVLELLQEGKAQVIDLTYPLNEKNAYWPGPAYSPFKYETLASIEKHGAFSGRYSTPEHLGTHLDAPNHFEPFQPPVDQLTLNDLIGPAVVIDICQKTILDADYALKVEDILAWETNHGTLSPGSIVLIHTGWGQRWGDYEKYKNTDAQGILHFPGYSKEAALFLAEKRSVKAIGIDTLSVDPGISKDFSTHHVFNSRGRWMLENLANIEKLPPKGATLIVAPIKIEGGSGGQARVWAIVPP